MNKRYVFKLIIFINLFACLGQEVQAQTKGINTNYIDTDEGEKTQMLSSQTQYAVQINKAVNEGVTFDQMDIKAAKLLEGIFSPQFSALSDQSLEQGENLISIMQNMVQNLPVIIRAANRYRTALLSVNPNSLTRSKIGKVRRIVAGSQAAISTVARALRTQQKRIRHKKIIGQMKITEYFRTQTS